MQHHWHTLQYTELDRDDLYDIMRLRQEVFVVEQNSAYLDADGVDLQAVHMLCREEGRLIAYQRLIQPGIKYSESSMGRIAVQPDLRGKDLGRELVKRGIEHNLSLWPADICISAQAHLQKFYRSMGFVSEGDIYAEDGIPHCKMRLSVV
jgi:ElaA protein